MNRRRFLTTAAACAIAPFSAQAAVNYTPGLVKDRLAKGEVVFLDFAADWCSTCAAQERVINDLRAGNPAYDQKITFVRVDWDAYRKSALTTELKVPRRSTLIVLQGDKELGRIVAGTRSADIKKLMDSALAAASAS
ncbi:thioredoxin family protein [Sagittula sp. SSi028]|uniref:thioredoxin family protein n=1 Tax=Sagittula sp. SSi028 TaxID=3400636 RepID=UPI003AF9E4D4